MLRAWGAAVAALLPVAVAGPAGAWLPVPGPEPMDPRCTVAAVVSCLQTLSGGGVPERYSRPSGPPSRPYVAVPCPQGSRFCATTLIAVPKVTTVEVARMARALLEMPVPVPRTRPWPKTHVGLRTFLWVQEDLRRTYRAVAEVAGRRVELTGRPLRVHWDLGDGQEVCTVPGGPDGPCSHVWTRSSPEPYAVTATVEYRVSWRCSGSCDAASGVLEPLKASGRTEVTVHELQTRAHGAG